MAEFHNGMVAIICGRPFFIKNGDDISLLFRMAQDLIPLDLKPDGTIATFSKEAAKTNALETHLVTQVGLRQIECVDCEEEDEKAAAEAPFSFAEVPDEVGRGIMAAIIHSRRNKE